jgi:hypothetical protein
MVPGLCAPDLARRAYGNGQSTRLPREADAEPRDDG